MIRPIVRTIFLCLLAQLGREVVLAAEPSRAESSRPPLPLEEITGSHKERVLKIIEHPVIHRVGQFRFFLCHPELLEWLIEHPSWVAAFWNQLGVDAGTVEEFEDGYVCRLDEQISIRFHVVRKQPGLRIVYCVGEVKRRLVPGHLRAEIVMVHRYRDWKQADGSYLMAQQIEGFASAKGITIRTVLKIAHSTGEHIVDGILENMMAYFSVVCRTIQYHPQWVDQVIEKIQHDFPPEETAELKKILRKIR